MLFSGFAGPLHLKRKTSRLLAIYLGSVYSLAALSLLLPTSLSVFMRLILYLGLVLSGFYHFLYLRNQYDSDSHYWVWQANGSWKRANVDRHFKLVSSRTFQTPWFVILCLTNDACERFTQLIVRDQLDADTFRRLRVRLKLHYDKTATGGEDAE